jgi:hypothetical protein
MVDLAPQVAAQADVAAKSSTKRYYVLGLLTVVYALNFLDRTIFNVLIEPIKKEFALSDTMMGLLAGALNDVLKSDFGAQAVRYSLPSTAVTTMLGALLFVVAARWIRGDIQRAA